MNPQAFKRVAFGIGIVILQVIFFRHLKVFNMQPDFVLLFLLWYMTKGNRTRVILMAAFLGLAQDALLDIWGLNMFAKTLLAFIGYNVISKNMDARLQLPRILVVVFIASLLHNLIFLILSIFAEHYTAELLFWSQWIGNSIYTTLVAGIVQLFRAK
ncbi:MAG: rod shape-determining protein MreD [Balneolaceae bacterium]|nr:rod shape-determining protein MreD [Balneolaceae bacterium]